MNKTNIETVFNIVYTCIDKTVFHSTLDMQNKANDGNKKQTCGNFQI